MRNVDTHPEIIAQLENTLANTQVLSSVEGGLRWRIGERLDHLFQQASVRFADRVAVLTAAGSTTYRALEARANQVARHLIANGVQPGDRVGLLFDRTVETYVALLAVMKAHATYVPLDAAFPIERVRFMLADAGIKTIVSMRAFTERLSAFDARVVMLDAEATTIDALPAMPLAEGEVASPADQACYIIYTSGTTGNPKGVVVEHPSICNFVRVAAETYGYQPGDRIYQGMTIAFDFSVEEVWVPLMAGATLVPGPSGVTMLGEELADFLRTRRVTAMCCCPTLLATIETELPDLRILIVGGEACPHNLVVRWSKDGRTILNTYGPTEATVTATVTELKPNKPVTIGKPLPTYSIVILDPTAERVMPAGELGEIGIAGVGLAAGYLNREDLTRQKFITDFVGIALNPSQRIYRTGDLGRIDDNGEVEYRGRIDTQVKIRGYRIELIEIEQVLLDMPQIAQAAVTTFEPEPGQTELVAYYAFKQGVEPLSHIDITQTLRTRLPAYMVPAYLEQLDVIPMTVSNKADHRRLPKPTGARCAMAGGRVVEAKTEDERALVRALAEVLKLETVSTEAHFFDDLGTNSLVMARFCARIRQQTGMANVSMRDIYQNPTIARLAVHLRRAANDDVAAAKAEAFHTPSDFAYYATGALQALVYGLYGLFGLWVFDVGFEWTYAAVNDPLALYARAVAFAVGSFVALSALPIAVKWLVIGRFKEESFPIWSPRYFRFWTVMTLMRNAPVVLFAGQPIYNLYLRLLGAKIGPNVVIESRFVPVCTDLIEIGADTILRKESVLLGYRAQANFIHTGRITLGRNAFVGEAGVIDIDTVMGDDTQLGHGSSLQSGQRIPNGKHYHGSPAVETSADYCQIDNVPSTWLRRTVFETLQLVGVFAIAVPAPILALIAWEDYAAAAGMTSAGWTSSLLFVSVVSFLGSLAAAMAAVFIVPRLCRPFLHTGKTYSLYGVHYWLQTIVFQFSNSRLLNLLFGDSSAVVGYIRALGWNLNTVEQTGSNFGTNQQHENPFLCNIGSGTMVSDGLSMINMHKSASSFRLEETKIGEHNYLGNNIHYPPGGRTGANCLLGTKVMIPVDGPVRENVGLLGSPPFEIPRIVSRDKSMIGAIDETTRLGRLARKNRHNLVTAMLFLFSQWLMFFATLAMWQAAFNLYAQYGVFALFGAAAGTSWVAVVFYALLERASLNFKRLEPKVVTIYDPYFWSHERHWKLSDSPIMRLFVGTPFKNLVSRMVGIKIGRKVFDGGCIITDRTLTEIGDGANLNEGSVLQAHSLEEGVFKSDYLRVGAGCTLGPAAFVHYGVTMGERSVLDADSFLMKGEEIEPYTVWRGNPAKLHRRLQATAEQASTQPTATCDDELPLDTRIAACVAAR